MVGIGNLFPFEVTGLLDSWRQHFQQVPTLRCTGEPTKERSKICRKALDYIRWAKTPQHLPIGSLLSNLLTPPLIVLDTNVVLDWLLFRDTSCDVLGAEIETGHLGWIASIAMHTEFDQVLRRRQFDAHRSDDSAVHAHWKRFCVPTESAALPAMTRQMRCTDPDDQMFIDLALSQRATWLLSRDRAVLKLASGARSIGTAILTPTAWAMLRH